MRIEKTKSAFTLVELLVVIGIIAMLVGILLPTLSSARESGRATYCLASLRQLGVGFQLYSTSFKGAIQTGQSALLDQFNNHGFEFTGRANVNCPTFRQMAGDVGPTQLGYGNNIWLASLVGQANADGRVFKLGRVRDITHVVLMADTAQYAAGHITEVAAGYINPYGMLSNNLRMDGKTLDTPMFHGRHIGRGSVLWLDGHATLEMPTYAPSGMTISGISSDTYRQFKIGYLIPPGTQLQSMPAQAYSFCDPSCLATTDNIKDLLRFVSVPGGTSYYTPLMQYWH